MCNNAVFLDRDDTIIKDVNYCSCPEDVHLLPKAAAGIRLLNQSGLKVIIITNQSGIARGYLDISMLGRIHEKLKSDLAQYGAFINAIYYCPHHPDDNCDCRKPKPGMLIQAAADNSIDLRNSYMVGDYRSDIEVGLAAGCKTVLINSNNSTIQMQDIPPDYVARHLYDAACWIVDNNKPV